MQVKIVSVEAKNNLKLLLSYGTGDQDIAPPTSCMSLELMFEFRRRYRLLSGLDTPSNRLNWLFNRLCLSNGFLC